MALPARTRRRVEPRLLEPPGDVESSLQRMVDMLEQAFGTWPPRLMESGEAFTPLADVEETDNSYILEVELPGVKKDDVDIELQGRRVTIAGERKERERTGVIRRRTRITGRFYHEVALPGDIDEAETTASMEDGVLTVRIAKAASERERTRKIEVT